MTSRFALLALPFGVSAGLLGCDNPTVDPDARVTIAGEVVDAFGRSLTGAEARLVKYWSSTNARAPTAEQLFAEDPAGAVEGDLRAELVAWTRVDRSGFFGFDLRGEDVAQPGGYVDGRGRLEVADVVLVVRDPADPSGRTGVYTYEHTFQQSDRDWDTGLLELWDADGRVVDEGAELELSWRALAPRGDARDEPYRVVIEPPAGGRRLVLNCDTGPTGGCEGRGDRVVRLVSAATIDRYYADPDGVFSAWVQADGRESRAVAALLDARTGGGTPSRSAVPLEGVWAAGDFGEEDLLDTAAVDGDPATRARVSGRVTEIYVKLRPAVITDAGVLGARLSGAALGCVEVEFTGTAHRDVLDARTSSELDWQPRGRFCGENGGPGEVSALVSFAAGGGVTFAWMRLRAIPFDPRDEAPIFREVGEVAVFTDVE